MERLLAARLVGIVRLDDLELTVDVASLALDAGLQVVEVTFTLPSAGRAIERLRRDHPGALVGAGSVRRLTELEDAAAAGAQFLVAPGLNPELIDAAARRGLPMLPGVFTATEVDLGLRLGAELLKLFPGRAQRPRLRSFDAAALPGCEPRSDRRHIRGQRDCLSEGGRGRGRDGV